MLMSEICYKKVTKKMLKVTKGLRIITVVKVLLTSIISSVLLINEETIT